MTTNNKKKLLMIWSLINLLLVQGLNYINLAITYQQTPLSESEIIKIIDAVTLVIPMYSIVCGVSFFAFFAAAFGFLFTHEVK